MPYHVRNVVPIEELRQGKKQAAKQEDIVLRYYELHPNQGFTPLAMHAALIREGLLSKETPWTSIRRAMTDLANPKYHNPPPLVKMEEQRPEIFGKHNHVWRLVRKQGQLELL